VLTPMISVAVTWFPFVAESIFGAVLSDIMILFLVAKAA
jgi:hypothetical protein